MSQTAQDKWFSRLERVFKDMPSTIEVTVHHHGMVEMHERGATELYFQEHGHVDNVPEIDSFTASNLKGRESSV